MGALAVVMEPPQMINMIALERNWNTDWPSGKFPMVWKKIKKPFGPDDNVAIMDMDEDLFMFKLNREKDPKTLLDDTSAVKIQYKCALLEVNKAEVIVRE